MLDATQRQLWQPAGAGPRLEESGESESGGSGEEALLLCLISFHDAMAIVGVSTVN